MIWSPIEEQSGSSAQPFLVDPFQDLKGKVAIVVGGGLGIGRSVARLLASCSAAVAVVDCDRQKAHDVAAELRSTGADAVPIVGDVFRRDEAQRVVDASADAFGRLDLLVNIVGGQDSPCALADLTSERLYTLITRNLAHHLDVGAAFRSLGSPSPERAIVVMSSVAALHASVGMGGYSAAKAALASLTKTMALEWAPDGIRVNAVAPGVTWTDRMQWGQPFDRAARETLPARRLGHQTEIANVVLFLLSNMAAYVTGQTLVVDGGMSLTSGYDRLVTTVAGPQC